MDVVEIICVCVSAVSELTTAETKTFSFCSNHDLLLKGAFKKTLHRPVHPCRARWLDQGPGRRSRRANPCSQRD